MKLRGSAARETVEPPAVVASRGAAVTPAATPAVRGGWAPRLDGDLLVGAATTLVFLGLWQLAASRQWVNPLFFGSPLGIVRAGRDLVASGQLVEDFAASAKLFAAGFLLSVVVGVPGGILLGWYRRVAAALDPLLSVLYVTPRIALIPLIFVWFGIDFQAQVVIVFLTAFFPLLVTTMQGVKSIDQDLLRVARSFMASDRDLFVTLALPSALPFVISGLRLSMSMALIGVVVAEFFTGNTGLGQLITTAGISLQTNVAFVGVAVIAAIALLFNALLRRLEAALAGWREVES